MQLIITRGGHNQFAYKKDVSCTDALLTLDYAIESGLNFKDTTVSKVLFLEFSSVLT